MTRRTRGCEEPACRLFVVVGGLIACAVALAGSPAGACAQDTGGSGSGGGPKGGTSSASDSTTMPASQRRMTQRKGMRGWLPRVRLDNDAYNFWVHPGHRSDEQYTNGVVLGLETLRAPGWGGWLGRHASPCATSTAEDRACLSTLVYIGQDMYTPNLDRPPFSYAGWTSERPYAAWLYVGGEGRRAASRTLRTYSMALGVTGAPALGEFTQSIAHHINARYTTEATGWETQVGFEPGVLVGLRESVLALRWAPGGRGILDLAPSIGGVVGNIRTSGDAGATLRLGINMSHPWDPRAWRDRADWELQVSAGGRREYVAHDFSLDGTLLHTPSREVTRVPTVDEYSFGTALRVRRLSVGWRAVTRSREYTTGPRHHAYSQLYSAIEFQP